MSANEQQLLDSWTLERDAEAFKTIANRYAGLVYATCLRILGNDTDAEDVAQECFLALAGAGSKPGGFLGAWLHRVATNKSLTRLRSERNRRKREKAWYRAGADPVAAAVHRDLCAVIDEAIARLPDDLRVPLVAHFIEDRTHDAIATDLGVSRQTVTYRIAKGIERIRKRLPAPSAAFSAASLAELLKPAAVPPASLLAQLGKLALAGPVVPVVGMTAFAIAKVGAMALAVVCVGGLAAVHCVHAHNRAKADAAWRDLIRPAISNSLQTKSAVAPALREAAPKESGKSAGNQTARSGNAAQPSTSTAVAATPVSPPDGSFQPYCYSREHSHNGQVYSSDRFFVLTPTLFRTEGSDGSISIGDTSTNIFLSIVPDEKIFYKVARPDNPPYSNRSAADKVEEWIRSRDGAHIESLGTIQIENKECRGLHSVTEYQEDTIWIDTQTNLPARIESHRLKEDLREVESQFTYGIDVNPALLSITPPEGYEVKEDYQRMPLGGRLSMFWRRVWGSI